MSITRDPNYPAEAAQLMQAFNQCADGFEAGTVINASLQMVAAAIGFIAKARGLSLEDALNFEAHISEVIRREVIENWNRTSAADAVEVKSS